MNFFMWVSFVFGRGVGEGGGVVVAIYWNNLLFNFNELFYYYIKLANAIISWEKMYVIYTYRSLYRLL